MLQLMSFPAEIEWAIGAEEQRKYDAIFESLSPISDKLSGDQCKPVLLNSQLPKTLLAKIWDLADMDADGFLDRVEFCVALHLVYRALQNEPIPDRLPPTLVPFNKRTLLRQIGVRSAEPGIGSHHPPPLTWSSRASSVTSLNYQPQTPLMSPPLALAAPLAPAVITATARKPSASVSSGLLFERNVEEWRVDNLSQFEPEFRDIDKNQDGLVEGSDLRDVFLRSGLSQTMLARIWAYVDVQKSGRLNLEQYAKCVLLIRDCKEEIEKPAAFVTTTQPIPVPNAPGTLGRRDSQISTNSSSGGGSIGAKLISENPRVLELTTAIEEMQANRRKAEQDLFQAEADLKVKNSEVKNMEIEQLTLEATVKQLKNQRIEANKRLNDLDTRIAKLEGVCGESQRRIDEEEARLARTKQDIQQAKEKSETEDTVLEQLQTEIQGKRNQLAKGKERLTAENRKFEGFVDELTQLERGIAQQEEESVQLREQIAEMKRILDSVEQDDENAKKELLDKTFQVLRTENRQWTNKPTPTQSFAHPFSSSTTAAVDPFKDDSFGNPIGNNDPFTSSISTENNAARIPENDPFAPKSGSSGSVAGIGNQKSSGAGQEEDKQFANFANFATFS